MSHAKIRPLVKWHGGKHYLARRIIGYFPPHDAYVEPFGGGASVLLNNLPANVEIYNDLDQRLYRLFHVLRHDADEFRRRLSLTPFHEDEFKRAVEDEAVDRIEAARRDYVRWRMSFGGQGKSFVPTLHRVRRGMADNVSGWLSSIDDNLPRVIDRLRRVQILNRPALEVIRKWDGPRVLIYCDPPYLAGTRQSPDVYRIEMTDNDHVELLDGLAACQGHVVLSGYRSPLYDDRLGGWHRVEIEIPNHAAGGRSKQRMTEVLWMNFTPPTATAEAESLSRRVQEP